jgi:DNA-binding NtrC family response regulator
LFFRLCVIQIQIQPLRNRREDVASLARRGLERIEGRLSLPRSRLSAEQIDRLACCDWYGNARELFNLLERLAIRCRGRSIQAADIDAAMAGTQIGPCEPAAIAVCDSDVVSDTREHITRMLEATNGNVALAARRLGMARSTLRRRIAHHGMTARRNSSQTECADAFGESVEDEAQRDHREYASVEPYEGLLADVAQ